VWGIEKMSWVVLVVIVLAAICFVSTRNRRVSGCNAVDVANATTPHAHFILVDSSGMSFERLARNLEAAGFIIVHVPQSVHLAKPQRRLHPALRRMVQEVLAIPGVINRCIRTRPGTVLIVSTMHVAYLAVAALLRALGQHRAVYLVNFYVHSRSQWRVFHFVMRRLLTDLVGVSVQSPGECDLYRRLPQRVTLDYIPYGQDQLPLWDPSATLAPVARSHYVFAGGYTNRDYATFVRAAARMPEIQFVLVCSRHNSFDRQTPDNVKVIEDVSFRDFHALLARAAVVVVPLVHDGGSSGQMVALAGMSYGVPVIYTDFSTVAQYFVPDVTGVAVPCGDVDALTRAIIGLLDSPERAKAMVDAARSAYVRSFTADMSLARVAEAAAAFWSLINANSHHRHPLACATTDSATVCPKQTCPDAPDRSADAEDARMNTRQSDSTAEGRPPA
jgi:glycosyltransferase involved in cell wall biosynthesis